MANITCPKCGTPNRAGARFCVRCATSLPDAVQPAASSSNAPVPVTPASAYATPPSAPPAYAPRPMPAPAHLNWQGKIGNGFKTTAAWLGRALTLSGRAAYADLFAPQPLAQGQVTSMTTRSSEASPLEPGFFIWILAWVAFGALLLITNQIWQIAAFVVLYLILLILSWLGLRQLAFSRQTLTTLAGLVTRKAQSVTRMQFNITTRRGQALVTMVGEIKGLTPTQDTEPQPGHFIQVWGTRTGDTIRAWKLEFLQVNWTPAGVWLSTPRLIPLSAGLLIPLAFWLVIRLLIAIVSGIK